MEQKPGDCLLTGFHFLPRAVGVPMTRMSWDPSEGVIRHIIRQAGQQCAAHGHPVSETAVAFMVRAIPSCWQGYRGAPSPVLPEAKSSPPVTNAKHGQKSGAVSNLSGGRCPCL